MNNQTNKNLTCHEAYISMIKNLSAMKRAGIMLTYKGKVRSPKDLAYMCTIKERGKYMSDYILDEKGNLKEVRFDYVNNL